MISTCQLFIKILSLLIFACIRYNQPPTYGLHHLLQEGSVGLLGVIRAPEPSGREITSSNSTVTYFGNLSRTTLRPILYLGIGVANNKLLLRCCQTNSQRNLNGTIRSSSNTK
jgi:hypothetical protein